MAMLLRRDSRRDSADSYVKEVEGYFKRALDPKSSRRSKRQSSSASASDCDEVMAGAEGMLNSMTLSEETAQWVCRVAESPEDFDVVYGYMLANILVPTHPLGELVSGFGDFLVARYQNAASKKALDEAAKCLTLGAKVCIARRECCPRRHASVGR